MTATVAILGRPNVGKSTLFNRLVGRKIALVDDQPGVTRDRREGEAKLGDLRFRLFDTAGLDDIKGDSLEARMSAQAETAVDDADVVLFVIDSRAGVTPTDREFAERVRRRGKPVILVANKAEGSGQNAGVLEGYELGFGEPLPISAEHGEGLDYLYEALLPYTEEKVDEDGEERGDGPLRLAIIGQPNAGKSTLVNTILGEERMLTGPEAGITRDAISSDFEWRGQKIRLWDTAGIRRKSRVTGKIEKLAVSDALRAIRFAECVVVLVDASLPIERQDLTLCDLVAQEGRAVVLALSKWDLVEEKQKKLKEVQSDLEDVSAGNSRRAGGDAVVEAGTRHRQDAGSGDGRHGALEHAHSDGAVEPLARKRHRAQSAASAFGPPHQDPLCDPGQCPPADLRHLRQPAVQDAGELQALSDERVAQGFRTRGRSHPLQPARRQEPVRQGQVVLYLRDQWCEGGRSEPDGHLAQMFEVDFDDITKCRRRRTP